MQRFFISLFFTLTISYTIAQTNRYGVPFITNYTPQEYGASEQNWAITFDNRGVIYIGNNTNIIEYDGHYWRKIPIPNNSIIRSLAADSLGNIYVGAVGDFGYLKPLNSGNYEYKSLLSKLDTTHTHFSDVWKTYIINDKVFFCTYKQIFVYENDKIKVIPIERNGKFSFIADSTFYLEVFKEGLKTLKGDSWCLLQNGQFFADKDVFFIIKYSKNELLIGTILDGIYVYDILNGSIKQFNKELNGHIKDSYLYHGCQISDTIICLATLQDGLYNVNKNGKIDTHVTPVEGLQDIIATYIYSRNISENPLWIALNKGFSTIEINSPFRKFDSKQGLEGSINDIIKFNNILYVSTDLGIYCLSFDKNNYPHFNKIEGINDQSWSFIKFKTENGEVLLVGTAIGIFAIKDKSARKIEIENHIENHYFSYKLYQDSIHNNVLFACHSKGLVSLKYNKGEWELLNSFPEISDEIRHIIKQNDSVFWIASTFHGLKKIIFNNESNFKIKSYALESGLEKLNDILFLLYQNKVYFASPGGLYSYDLINDNFIHSQLFGNYYAIGKTSISKISYGANLNEFYICSSSNDTRTIVHIKMDTSEFATFDTLPFKRLPNEQFDAIYHDSDGITWLGSSSGLYSYNPNVKVDYYKPYHTLVRKVITVNDSVLFWGTNYTTDSAGNRTVALEQPAELIPVLDYKYNDLTFEYAAPYFIEEKKTEYSYLLEGYKDTWSKWSTEPKAVFTNLREGKYIFKVKAKNIYGIESTVAEYRFSIQPPFYRTIMAYIFYIILAVIFIVIIVKLYTRKLEQEKVRLEVIVMERTVEIRCQKEEIEQQAEKLKEANHTLIEQKEEILKQKEEITSSIKYAKRIQQAIVPSVEKATELLHDYFLLWRPRDIVSGDFWWLGEKGGYIVVAAADCTGHGVPGAFMSMLGVSFLNEIVNQQENTQSHEILNKLRTKVKSTLGQTGKEGEAKDGMDIALAVIDFNSMTLQFSGAYNPLYLYRDGQVEVYKADRNPIGIYIKEKESFTQNIIQLQKGDTFYIFSDGILDQFGGPDKMKFGSNRLKETLDSIQQLTMAEQREKLNEAIENWRGDTEQIDDIIVLGVRI